VPEVCADGKPADVRACVEKFPRGFCDVLESECRDFSSALCLFGAELEMIGSHLGEP
jgi:hypothetical protein